MTPSISHDRKAETLRAKTVWFQSLTLAERMDYLCEFTDLVMENNPRVALKETRNAQSLGGRIRVLATS